MFLQLCNLLVNLIQLSLEALNQYVHCNEIKVILSSGGISKGGEIQIAPLKLRLSQDNTNSNS